MSYIKVMDELIEKRLERMGKVFFHKKLLFQDKATGVKNNQKYLYNSELKCISKIQ